MLIAYVEYRVWSNGCKIKHFDLMATNSRNNIGSRNNFEIIEQVIQLAFSIIRQYSQILKYAVGITGLEPVTSTLSR